MKKTLSIISVLMFVGALVLMSYFVIAPFFEETEVIENMEEENIAHQTNKES